MSSEQQPAVTAAQVDVTVATYCVDGGRCGTKAAPHYAKQRHSDLTATAYDDCHGHVIASTPDDDYIVAVYDSPVDAVYEVTVPDISVTDLSEKDGYVHPSNDVWHTSRHCAGFHREAMTFGEALSRDYSICRLCADAERTHLTALQEHATDTRQEGHTSDSDD